MSSLEHELAALRAEIDGISERRTTAAASAALQHAAVPLSRTTLSAPSSGHPPPPPPPPSAQPAPTPAPAPALPRAPAPKRAPPPPPSAGGGTASTSSAASMTFATVDLGPVGAASDSGGNRARGAAAGGSDGRVENTQNSGAHVSMPWEPEPPLPPPPPPPGPPPPPQQPWPGQQPAAASQGTGPGGASGAGPGHLRDMLPQSPRTRSGSSRETPAADAARVRAAAAAAASPRGQHQQRVTWNTNAGQAKHALASASPATRAVAGTKAPGEDRAAQTRIHGRLQLRSPSLGAAELGRLDKTKPGGRGNIAASTKVAAREARGGSAKYTRHHTSLAGRMETDADHAPHTERRVSRGRLAQAAYAPLESAFDKLATSYRMFGDRQALGHTDSDRASTGKHAVLAALRTFNGVAYAAPPFMRPHTFVAHVNTMLAAKLTPLECGALCRFFDTQNDGSVDFSAFLIDFTRRGEEAKARQKHAAAHREKVRSGKVQREVEAQRERLTRRTGSNFVATTPTDSDSESVFEKLKNAATRHEELAHAQGLGGLDVLLGSAEKIDPAGFREQYWRAYHTRITAGELGVLVQTFDTDNSGRIDCAMFRVRFNQLRIHHRRVEHDARVQRNNEQAELERKREREAQQRFGTATGGIIWPEESGMLDDVDNAEVPGDSMFAQAQRWLEQQQQQQQQEQEQQWQQQQQQQEEWQQQQQQHQQQQHDSLSFSTFPIQEGEENDC